MNSAIETTGTGTGHAFQQFEFSDGDFRRLKKMIFEYAGISLNDSKRAMAYGRIAKRLRAVGLKSFKEYLDSVETADGDERVEFVNALTTNLTYFFREPHHFPTLVEHLQQRYAGQTMTIWSAACSTGEEPYSIAIAAIEAFATDDPPIRIIASDLDTHALEVAERGVYSMEKLESLAPARLKRFFLRGTGAHAGYARIRPQVSRLVEFRQINLHDDRWDVGGPLAAIFCRNVMIYFNKETQTRILERFVPLLKPSGLLFAGHSENFFYNAGDLFSIRGKTVYEVANNGGG